MGRRGPAPKRTDQRRRRNSPAAGLRQVELYGRVEPPALDLEDVHPVAEDFYNALLISGQTRYYEPSDWQRARVFVKLLSDQLKAGKPSSMMYAALQRDMDALLVSEPERRRVQMEISREPTDTSAEDAEVAQMQEYRRIAEEP